jgi:hypothetical protein
MVTLEANVPIDPHQMREADVREKPGDHGVVGARDEPIEAVEVPLQTESVTRRGLVRSRRPWTSSVAITEP